MKHRMEWLLLGCLLSAALAGCSRHEKVIGKLDDARDARIGVMTGSTGEAIVAARYPDAAVKSFDDIMDAVAAMASGQLDAAVTAFPAAFQVTKMNANLRLIPEPLDYENTAVAVRKDDTELLDSVNRIIDELRADGTLESMKRRWFKQDLGPYEELAIQLPADGTPLKIGVSATREPFSFVDQNGRVTGHDGELARLIGDRLYRPVEFYNMKFMALIPALQSGKVDLIVTGMTATEERRHTVAFSQPYFLNSQVMIVRQVAAAGSPTVARKLAAVDELKDRRVGVLMGSAHETWVLRNLPQATMLQYKSVADVTLAIKHNKVDAALYDAEVLKELMREDTTLGRLGGPLFSFDVGAGFASDADSLRQEFNAFLLAIRKTGVYDDMLRRWVNDRMTGMPNIDNRRDKGVLVAGVSDVGLPFVAVRNNRLVGFDIELAERFAAHLGRELRLANMDFGSLVAAVSSGKADLIVSSIYITPEREQKIDFSAPYFAMETHVAGLKANIADYEGAVERTQSPSFLQRIATSFHANIVRENRYRLILDGLLTTVIIALSAAVFGTVLGGVICFMRMSRGRLLNVPARIYIALLRGTPVLVVLMLVFYVVFASVDISPVLAAIIAFGMNFAAYVAEIFRAGIAGVDKGQSEAGLAMGFTRAATFIYIVLPQMVRRFLPVYKGEFISLVKMTSIVGYIAVQDLTKASDIIRSRTFDAFFPLLVVAILYFAISWVLIQALNYVEFRLDPKAHRRTVARA
jgi:polar amino acid transport system substrate-binding protein